MKQIYSSIIFIFLFTNLFSQDYSLFKNGVETMFDFENNNNFMANYSSGFWLSAKPNYIGLSNGDTIIYHAKIFKNQEYPTGNGCATLGDTSWLGTHTIIKSNGDHYFFNRYGDSILLRPQAVLNATWTVYQWQNGDYIEAKILNNNFVQVSNVMDSVKAIGFQAKNAQHQNISHPINGLQLQISQHYGFIQAINFFDFPNDDSYAALIGHKNLNTPYYNITSSNIYNFDVGDEMHIEGLDVYAPSGRDDHFEIQRVIDKQTLNDTVSYQIERQRSRISTDFSSGSEDTTYTIDTITFYPHYSSSILDSLPYHYTPVTDLTAPIHSYVSSSNYGNFSQKNIPRVVGYYVTDDTCLTQVIDGFTLESYYLEGLGGPYYDRPSTTSTSRRELVFYKKNTITWGTPINIQNLIPTSINQFNYTKNITIAPNPTTHQITISTSNEWIENGQLTIFNHTGQVIWTDQNLSFNTKMIDVSDWSNGVYLIQIQSTDGIWVGRFIKQ